MRLRATLLLLFACALVGGPADARGREEFPPAGRATIVGRVGRIPSTVTLRVLEDRFEPFPELLAEADVESGPFRFRFPGPERTFRSVGTARGLLLPGDAFRPPNSIYRQSDPMEPLPTAEVLVRVADDQERGVPGARVVRTMGLPGWEESRAIGFLTEEFVADERGFATVVLPVGARAFLIASAGGRRSRLRQVAAGERSTTMVLPTRTRLRLRVDPDRFRGGPVPDAREIAVTVQTGDGWAALTGAALDSKRWEGVLPAGATAIRVAQPGFGTVEVRDEHLAAERSEFVYVELPGEPRTDLKVLVLPPDLHPPLLRKGPAGCLQSYSSPWREEACREGTDTWVYAGFVPEGFGCCIAPPRDPGIEPGRYRVRVRGWLLEPTVREVDVKAGVTTVVRLHPGSGGGIHLVARRRGGRPEETVSFTVKDEEGEPAGFLYTAGGLWYPAAAFDGPVVEGAPNGGVAQLPPGRYRVVWRPEGGLPSTHEVRVYAGIVTRLELSPPTPNRSGSDRLR